MLNLAEVYNRKIQKLKMVLMGLLASAVVLSPLTIHEGLDGMVKNYVYRISRSIMRYEAFYSTRNFDELQGEHFIIRFQPQDREIAPLVLANAEASYTAVAKNWSYDSDRKDLIVIYPDDQQMKDSLNWPLEKSPMGAYQGGVVKVLSPYAWVPEGDYHQMEKIFAEWGPVAHELTHLAVDYQTNGNHQRWLTEGIAQYTELSLGGVLWTGSEDLAGKRYTLEELEKDFDALDDQSLAYLQSYYAVDYLMNTYGKETVSAILKDLGKGMPAEKAFAKNLGRSYEEFSRDVMEYWETLNSNL
jgi:hypothetical protein